MRTEKRKETSTEPLVNEKSYNWFQQDSVGAYSFITIIYSFNGISNDKLPIASPFFVSEGIFKSQAAKSKMLRIFSPTRVSSQIKFKTLRYRVSRIPSGNV